MDLHAHLFSSSFPGRKGMTLTQNAGGFLSEQLHPSPEPQVGTGTQQRARLSSCGLVFQAHLPSPAEPDLAKPIPCPLLSGSPGSCSSGKGPHWSCSPCACRNGYHKGHDGDRNVGKEQSGEVAEASSGVRCGSYWPLSKAEFSRTQGNPETAVTSAGG